MLEVEYKVIRDRQLKELELGDDLLSKTPVSRLYTESYEFVKSQRIKCLLIGDCDFTEKTFIRDGIEDLPERIDLSLVTDIMTGPSPQITSTPWSPPKVNLRHLSTNTIMTNNNLSQDLTFSLLSGPDTVLTGFIARDYTQYSEWTDRLNMLFDKNINSKDTVEYIHILTEIGVKVKLLDLSGE
ncbi:hypothetical protein RclHR1_01130004 [Rhizophagus clarus]|uniref:PH domain-containing protein n=1 Tax=Rhizophagus clarus TaxID=94130 RepID=A0A2Z6QVM2_9GLOM|nr:hypothetical protein RclHR1_01130004 [Rhizophagus clarus]